MSDAATKKDEVDDHSHIPEENRIEMAVLDRTGNTKTIWDITKPDEVVAAKILWEELVTKNKLLAFKVDDKGKRGEQVKMFDLKAGRYIFV